MIFSAFWYSRIGRITPPSCSSCNTWTTSAEKFRIGRSPLTLFRRGPVAKPDADTRQIHARVDAGHDVTREFAKRINGAAMGSITENAFNLPTTAHITRRRTDGTKRRRRRRG
ncbi:MAG: hypothetical protein U0X92_19225 [Anaerolineales bacterium]